MHQKWPVLINDANIRIKMCIEDATSELMVAEDDYQLKKKKCEDLLYQVNWGKRVPNHLRTGMKQVTVPKFEPPKT